MSVTVVTVTQKKTGGFFDETKNNDGGIVCEFAHNG
jgi:hypothetical protein